MPSPPNFTRLSSLVYLRDPPSASSPNAPLLILCSWMGAPPKLVAKYTTEYIRLYPDSPILLITSTARDWFFSKVGSHDALIRPALDVVLRYVLTEMRAIVDADNSRQSRTIIAAIYSNAGVHSLTRLAYLYRERTGKPLPVQRHLLDSGPGTGDLDAGGHIALLYSLPPSLHKGTIGGIMGGLIYAFLWLFDIWLALTGMMDPITRVRMDVNDPDLLVRDGVQRTYIYSESDRIVPYKTVEGSAADARALGWDARLEKFKGSGHVAHAMVDRERYWVLVRDTLGAVEK